MNAKRRIPIVLAVITVLILVLRFVVFRSTDDASVIVASGTVEATQADLGFQIPGRIEQIDAQEGDAVTRSSKLAWLDRAELQARKGAAWTQCSRPGSDGRAGKALSGPGGDSGRRRHRSELEVWSITDRR